MTLREIAELAAILSIILVPVHWFLMHIVVHSEIRDAIGPLKERIVRLETKIQIESDDE